MFGIFKRVRELEGKYLELSNNRDWEYCKLKQCVSGNHQHEAAIIRVPDSTTLTHIYAKPLISKMVYKCAVCGHIKKDAE